jgi:hypothetical protein
MKPRILKMVVFFLVTCLAACTTAQGDIAGGIPQPGGLDSFQPGNSGGRDVVCFELCQPRCFSPT